MFNVLKNYDAYTRRRRIPSASQSKILNSLNKAMGQLPYSVKKRIIEMYAKNINDEYGQQEGNEVDENGWVIEGRSGIPSSTVMQYWRESDMLTQQIQAGQNAPQYGRVAIGG